MTSSFFFGNGIEQRGFCGISCYAFLLWVRRAAQTTLLLATSPSCIKHVLLSLQLLWREAFLVLAGQWHYSSLSVLLIAPYLGEQYTVLKSLCLSKSKALSFFIRAWQSARRSLNTTPEIWMLPKGSNAKLKWQSWHVLLRCPVVITDTISGLQPLYWLSDKFLHAGINYTTSSLCFWYSRLVYHTSLYGSHLEQRNVLRLGLISIRHGYMFSYICKPNFLETFRIR